MTYRREVSKYLRSGTSIKDEGPSWEAEDSKRKGRGVRVLGGQRGIPFEGHSGSEGSRKSKLHKECVRMKRGDYAGNL